MRCIDRSWRRLAITIAALVTGLPVAADAQAEALVPLPAQPAGVAWPTAQWPEAALGPEVDEAALEAAVADSFRAVGRSGFSDTRALLLIHRGNLVFERYADGFGVGTRFHSWSMAKSFTQAFVGLLIGRSELALDAAAGVPEWEGTGDPRGAITLRQLLHMTAGLDNADDSGGEGADSFVGRLLFAEGSADTAAFAAAAPAVHAPGTHWAYSTATTAILSRIVGRAVGPDAASRGGFMRASLFQPLGMRSAVFAFDPAGTHLGGSHLYATARDYARFGLLYLRDGVWEGRQFLPPGWVDFSRTRAPVGNNGTYAGHFWLNLSPKEGQFRMLPGGPPSAFAANGNSGQVILMVPTHDLLLVRLGEHQATTWDEMNQTHADIVAAFPSRTSAPVEDR